MNRISARFARGMAGLSAVAVLAACSVSPKELSPEAIKARVQADRSQMYAGQEPITGPLTFADVAARVMKDNLDFRLRMMEATLAQRQLDVGKWDMFPRVLANGGWLKRDNVSGGRSVSIETGNETLANSSSQERSRRVGGLEFSWSLLDFGVSYYRARALADQALIAEERKRKVLQNLMQDTRAAYWRAMGAQRLTDRMSELMNRSQTALARARQIEQQGLLPQAQALAYQRALLDSTTLLQIRRQDLEIAKAELAALMNLPPMTDYRLADTLEPELPPLPADIEKLENLALAQRPELREEDYRKRISGHDARRALLGVLPNISFDVGGQYDSNRFLYHNSWAQAGLRVSADLLRLASLPSINRAADAQVSVDDTRRMAQAMAVLTQTRVAALRYSLAREELQTMGASARVDRRLANFARASANSRVDSELELIRTEARALLSEYQRQIAYANAQNAWGRLYNSLGLDLAPAAPGDGLKNISKVIDVSMNQWHKGVFARAPEILPRASMALDLQGVDLAIREEVREGLKQALRHHRITVAEHGANWQLAVVADIRAAADAKSGEGKWRLMLKDKAGRRLSGASYVGRLPARPTMADIRASAQLALDANAAAIVAALEPDSTKRLATSDK